MSSCLVPSFLICCGEAFQRDAGGLGENRFAGLGFAVIGDFAGLFTLGDDHELVAGLGQAFQSENLHRSGRTSFVQSAATIVKHGANLAEDVADDKVFAGVQGSIVDQYGGHRAASAIELGFQHGTGGEALGRCLELLHVRHQADHFHELVEIGVLLGRNIHVDGVATPVFGQQAAVGKLLLDAVGLRFRLVDLVDGDDERNLGGLGVVDGLKGLRHDSVIGGNHQNHDVRDLGAAGAHAGEGFVTRGIQEDDLAAKGGRVGVRDLHLVGADVLGDAARFAFGHVGGANGVEQAGFAVIDVAHDGDHRRTGDGVEDRFVLLLDGLRIVVLLNLILKADDRALGSEVAGHVAGEVFAERLVDGGEDATSQQARDEILGADAELFGKILYADAFRDGNRARDRHGLIAERKPGRRRETLHRSFLLAARACITLAGTAGRRADAGAGTRSGARRRSTGRSSEQTARTGRTTGTRTHAGTSGTHGRTSARSGSGAGGVHGTALAWTKWRTRAGSARSASSTRDASGSRLSGTRTLEDRLSTHRQTGAIAHR